jgi:hypothetical protein
MSNVVIFPAKRPDLAELVARLKELVYEYSDRITVPEALGAMELAKLEIFNQQWEDT